jgi:Na+/melibiose symporter-like transporter
LIFGVIGLPIILFVNGPEVGQDGPLGYIVLIVVLGAILIGSAFFMFVNLRKKLAWDAAESGVDKESLLDAEKAKKKADAAQAEKLGAAEMIKTLFTNGPLISIILCDGLRYIGRASLLGMLVYFFRYVVGDPGGTAMFLGMSGVMALVGSVLTEIIVHKIPKKTMYVAGYIIMILCYLAMFFFGTTTLGFTVIGAIWYIGLAFVNSTQVGLYSDAVDYGVYKAGKDCRAWLMAIAGYPPKMGNVGRALITGFGLVIIGFSASVDPTAEVIFGMQVLMCLLPAAIFVVGLAILLFGYRLNDQKMLEIQAELKKKGLAG